jgi:hypothetical protein
MAFAAGTRLALEAKLGLAALYYTLGQYATGRELFGQVLNEATDWDLVQYTTYRLKELDRQMMEKDR